MRVRDARAGNERAGGANFGMLGDGGVHCAERRVERGEIIGVEGVVDAGEESRERARRYGR